MTTTQDPQFTVLDIQRAIEMAKLGRTEDIPEPLRELAEGIAYDTDYIYRITSEDIDMYLEDCADQLTEQQRQAFIERVRKYIDDSGAFGESLQICLDLALADVLAQAAEKPAIE